MAGKPSKSSGKSGYKKKKRSDSVQPEMKIVTVDTCIVCTNQCSRGLHYIKKMSQPGATGFGVPCILTLK